MLLIATTSTRLLTARREIDADEVLGASLPLVATSYQPGLRNMAAWVCRARLERRSPGCSGATGCRHSATRSASTWSVLHCCAGGQPEQQERHLRPIAKYQEIWCQLFSEPGAGSDLAGLATRAVRDGDMWVLRGQKLWTSLGEIASFGLLLARTDPEVPKHRGITAFIIPMNLPGVTVRPVRQITGDAEFCEVFFDDASLYDSMRLGPLDEGWRVAISVLMNERTSVSGGGDALPGTVSGRSIGALIQRHAPVTDPVMRQRLAQAYIEDRLVTFTNQRAAARRRSGQLPGPGGSISKLFYSEHTQRLQNLAVDLEGAAAQAWDPDDRWLKGTAWSLLRVRAKTIAGGTSEVQRNILGERILGLPKEAEVDRDIPWSQVLRS